MPKEESPNNLRLFQKLYNKNRESLIFSSLAEEYRELGMITEAIQTSLEGLSSFPDCASARTTLALCYMDRGDVEGARRELEKVISKDCNLLYPLSLLMKCYEKNGEIDKALQIARHILKKYPFDNELDIKVKEWERHLPPINTPEPIGGVEEAAQNFQIKNVGSLFERLEIPNPLPTFSDDKRPTGRRERKLNRLSNILSMLRGITNAT